MATISSTFKMQDNATKTLRNVAAGIDNVADKANEANNKTSNIKNPQKDVESGFSKWQAKIVAANQALQLVQSTVRAIGQVMDFVDTMTLSKARIGLINDGLQTTSELQDKIYAAAERSRGSYQDMAASISKLGLLAGESFNSNDEMIAFSEMMNKAFKVSGSSQQEISSATYQLTQAMAAGKLQGDEFRAIMENAPMLADAIAKYMGKSKGELKELSREGVITSDIIKNSLFSAADEINAKYQEMPKTFGDAMTSMKNAGMRYLQPVADKITEMLNSERFNSILNSTLSLIQDIAGALLVVIQGVAPIISFVLDNLPIILMLTGLAAIAYGVTLPMSLKATRDAANKAALAWLKLNWQVLAIASVGIIVAAVMYAMKAPMEAIVGVIMLIVAALAIWKIVQWATNAAMYACPIVWIIILVIALIAAIYLFMQWIAKATGLANSGLGMIAGGVNVVIQFFKNLGLLVANIALGIWNALGACADNIGIAFKNTIASIKSWFYGMLETVMNVILKIVETLNKLPFIDIDTSGIENKAQEYANKKAQAEDSKEEYKSVSEAFDKGMNTFEAFGEGWVNDAFEAGKNWGDNAANKIGDALGSFDPSKALGDIGMGDTGEYDYSSMLDSNGNVPVSVQDGEIDITDEDLKMLKDIATREYMLNYKQITPNVNITFGDVRETADVNAVRDAISKMMEDELSELYVVEEA